jgi:hypothetical protein
MGKLSQSTASVCVWGLSFAALRKIAENGNTQRSLTGAARLLRNGVTVVNLIAHTTTSKGLMVKSAVDTKVYSKGIEVTDEELAKVKLKPHDFHGGWNYTVKK